MTADKPRGSASHFLFLIIVEYYLLLTVLSVFIIIYEDTVLHLQHCFVNIL